MSETDLVRAIREAMALERDVLLFRNNSGVAQSDYKGKHSFVRYGLAPGMPDLVGMLRGGRWFCLEVKTPNGGVRPEQKVMMLEIRAMGGFAAVVRSVEQAREALERARRGESQ